MQSVSERLFIMAKNSASSNDDAVDTSLFITVRRIGEQY